MKTSFGQAFRAFRLEKGVSQSELARQSGIATRTIVYWEGGEHLPRIPELQAVLEAMKATDEETRRLTDLLTTPRGLRLISTDAGSSEPLPGMGDLLRAMRLRRGLTQGAMAEQLQVTRHSVIRWEAMQNLIHDDTLLRLCELLQAAPEEQHALQTRRLPLPHWEALDIQNVEELGQIWHDITTTNSPLRDLYALALKRHLRVLPMSNVGVVRLLGQIEAQHGIWLHFQNRQGEATDCIGRALPLMEQDETVQPFWAATLNQATYYAQLPGKDISRSIRLLEKWLPRLGKGRVRTLLLSDMAIYVAQSSGSWQAAQQWLTAAERSSEETAKESEQGYVSVSAARVDLMLGHSLEACEELVERASNVMERLNWSLIWAKELLAQNKPSLASHFLRIAEDLFTPETPPRLRREWEKLCLRL